MPAQDSFNVRPAHDELRDARPASSPERRAQPGESQTSRGPITGKIPTRGATGKTKILIAAANPDSEARLRLGEELREIEAGLRSAQRRDSFELTSRQAVRPRDLQQALVGEKPQIVHFCGHGSREGDLMLEDDSGKANAVTPEALAELFSLCSHFVECVVLNACHTRTQADAISRHIPYVIGMDKSIGDRAAIRYAVGFYDALGAGMAYGYAHSLGCNLLRLENIPEHLTPVLRASPEAIPAKTDFRILGRMSREEIDGTLRQYKAAVAAGTEDGDAHLSLGLLYLHLGLHDPAMRHFRRALDLDPALADGYYYLALASVRGRRPKALMLQEVRAIERHVAAAIELDERPAKYYYFLAAVKQDYYSANGLRAPVPSVPTLLDLAASRDHDVWEIERLLSLLPLGDNELLARIRR